MKKSFHVLQTENGWLVNEDHFDHEIRQNLRRWVAPDAKALGELMTALATDKIIIPSSERIADCKYTSEGDVIHIDDREGCL